MLLFDTSSSVEAAADLIQRLWNELAHMERDADREPAPVAPTTSSVPEFPGYKGVYWCERNIFVVRVPDTIEASLSRVLRLYHTYVRHQAFALPLGDWDFIKGKVGKKRSEPIAVEGQIWTPL